MAVNKQDVTGDKVGQDRTKGALVMRAVRVDNTVAETPSVVDFAQYGLGNVVFAQCWDRTTSAFITATISALTTVTSGGHAGGDDVTIFAWGTIATPAQLAS